MELSPLELLENIKKQWDWNKNVLGVNISKKLIDCGWGSSFWGSRISRPVFSTLAMIYPFESLTAYLKRQFIYNFEFISTPLHVLWNESISQTDINKTIKRLQMAGLMTRNSSYLFFKKERKVYPPHNYGQRNWLQEIAFRSYCKKPFNYTLNQ